LPQLYFSERMNYSLWALIIAFILLEQIYSAGHDMKHFISFTLFYLLLSVSFLMAQTPDTLWTRTYGGLYWDNASSICQTTDGGYIITGFTESFGILPRDIWLVKTDDRGDTLWTRTLGGPGEEYANCVRQTSDEGYIVAGQTTSFGAGAYDLYLIKLNTSGDTLWTKTYGGVNSDNANDVRELANGGYILCGSTNNDAWIIKTDSLGNTLWNTSVDKSMAETAESVCETGDGGFMAIGASGAFGLADILLIKLNGAGDILWTRTYGIPGYNWGHDIIRTPDGGFVAVGTIYMPDAGGEQVWMLRMNAAGDTVWSRNFGGNDEDWGFSIQYTSDSGYIIGGTVHYSGSPWYQGLFIKTDSAGKMLWSKTCGGIEDEWILSVQQTTDGGYIGCGFTSSFGAGNRDMWVVKLGQEVSSLKPYSERSIPAGLQLFQNYPNPFNPVTTFMFDLPKTSRVTLKVYNILGEEVETLLSASLLSGSYSYHWDASRMASGIYLYRLEADDQVRTGKMVLMR
jgi:hypothetical protein